MYTTKYKQTETKDIIQTVICLRRQEIPEIGEELLKFKNTVEIVIPIEVSQRYKRSMESLYAFYGIQQDFNELVDNFLNNELIKISVYPEIKKLSFETVLVLQYKYIPEVKAIYIDEYLEEKTINIFLSIRHYNDDLMENLIKKELNISKIYPKIVATYNYIPNLIDNRYDIIGEKSKLIFEK